ncbi:MAG: hypothetical protein IJT43_11925 [Stomatobaculum sp.]|nr:hypothetical protein [Stomatobaculum sp.]
MRRVMAVLDRDKEYASRLASYLNSQERIGFRTTAFSSPSALKEFRKTARVEILLLAEDLAGEVHGLTEGAKVILLSDDGFVQGGDQRPYGAPAVFKYLPADRIAREIMNLYAEDDSRCISRARRDQCEIYGIYSPVNRCGKTTLALTLGLVHARRGRTLFLTLEEFPGVFRSIQENMGEDEEDLSDVIYRYLQGAYSWSRLKGAVHSFGALDYIPPVRCAEDISQVTSEDLARLFRRIAEEGGYASIILDFGSFGRRAAELLDLCSRIFMPVVEDPASSLKLESFQEFLRRSGKEELKDRIVKCALPWEPEKASDYARGLISVYESGILYEYAARLH